MDKTWGVSDPPPSVQGFVALKIPKLGPQIGFLVLHTPKIFHLPKKNFGFPGPEGETSAQPLLGFWGCRRTPQPGNEPQQKKTETNSLATSPAPSGSGCGGVRGGDAGAWRSRRRQSGARRPRRGPPGTSGPTAAGHWPPRDGRGTARLIWMGLKRKRTGGGHT